MQLQFLWEPYCCFLSSTITWKVTPQNLQSAHICLIVAHMVPHIWMMHVAFILQTCLNQNNHISLSVLKLCLTGFHLLTDFFFFLNSYSYGLSDCTGICPLGKDEGSTYDRKAPIEWHSVYWQLCCDIGYIATKRQSKPWPR